MSKAHDPRPPAASSGLPDAGAAQQGGADRHQRVVSRVSAELEGRLLAPLAAGLYLVATPIGNLADITLRALAILANASEIYCEDTRQSQKLLARYGLDRRLQTYHEHNAARERPRILAALGEGKAIALISDAGTPLISDPGFKLARVVIEAGYDVVTVPGASAALAALTVSGLATDSFSFCGFLPPKTVARRNRIAELAGLVSTIVVFETAPRLADALADLADVLGDRPAAVARELTKLHEHVRRGCLAGLAEWARAEPVKGEIVIVIGPAPARQAADPEIEEALELALTTSSVRDAATAVAAALGVSRSRVYDLAVRLKRRGDRDART